MVDSVYRTRSLGTPAEGLRDQYANGKAAKVWEVYIGDKNSRTEHYKNFLMHLLQEKKCHKLLDVACGTGIDSIMLVEEGYLVTSVDASDKMLKFALKKRWARRKESNFDSWVIEEANWLTLGEDLRLALGDDASNGNQFDALLCLGNSFSHLPDFTGDLGDIKKALKNFAKCVKPGGILTIDHRNFDYILDTGKTPSKNIYYNSKCVSDIQTSLLYKNGKPSLVTMDYEIKIGDQVETKSDDNYNHFRLSYYPHRLESFTNLLMEAFDHKCKHTVYGDFRPMGEVKDPAFFIHVVEKLDE